MREDLVQNAVTFLQDSTVASSPLAKRIEFLENKSLSRDEIEEAIRRSSSASSAPTPPDYRPPSSDTYYPPYAPPLPQRDWRDWFVMATVTGGVGYGLYHLTKRYVLPLILPPTPSTLESDKKEITRAFDEAHALLEQLQSDTEVLKKAEVERKERVDAAVTDMEVTVEALQEQLRSRNEEFVKMKTDIENIRELLPRALEKHKDAQTQSLTDLQNELKSLKSLLISRTKAAASASGMSNGGGLAGSMENEGNEGVAKPARPTIPAWQLATESNSEGQNGN